MSGAVRRGSVVTGVAGSPAGGAATKAGSPAVAAAKLPSLDDVLPDSFLGRGPASTEAKKLILLVQVEGKVGASKFRKINTMVLDAIRAQVCVCVCMCMHAYACVYVYVYV